MDVQSPAKHAVTPGEAGQRPEPLNKMLIGQLLPVSNRSSVAGRHGVGHLESDSKAQGKQARSISIECIGRAIGEVSVERIGRPIGLVPLDLVAHLDNALRLQLAL